MAGLLDFLNTPDGQGLLSAAFGGLAGARTGQPINSIGRAGLAGLSGYTGAQDREQQNATDAMRNKYMQSQMDNLGSEIEARKLAATKYSEQQDLIKSIFPTGGGMGGAGAGMSPGAFAPSIDGRGPTMPPQMQMQAQPQGGGLANMTPDMVARLKLGGLDLTDIYKFSQEPQKYDPGSTYKDRNTGKERFIPKVGDGVAPDQFGFYNPLPGYGAANAAIKGAEAGAVEGAKSGFKPIKVFNSEKQQDEYVSESTVLGGQGQALPNTATAPGSFRQANPNANLLAARPGESDQSQIYAGALASARQQLATARTPEDANRARSDIAGIQGEMSKAGIRSPAPQSGNFAAGPSANEAARADGLKARIVDSGKAGTARIMTGYEGALSASDMLISNAEARKSISGGAFQGAGADTKLAISKALNGLGFSVAPDQVTNTDYLQSTLGQGILNKAKTLGANPTDNDARIIRTIVGSIGTDPRALDKLIDHQDVMANRSIDSHNRNYKQAQAGGFDAGYNLNVERPNVGTKPAAAPAAAVQPYTDKLREQSYQNWKAKQGLK